MDPRLPKPSWTPHLELDLVKGVVKKPDLPQRQALQNDEVESKMGKLTIDE